MDVYGERTAVLVVSHKKELLEQLCIEDGDKEVKARIVIRDDSKECYLLFSQRLQIKLIGRGQRCKALKVELFKSCGKGDLNGLQGFCRTRSIRLVILQSNMIRVLCFKHCKQIVKRTSLGFILLVNVTRAKQLHNHREILLLGRCFILQVENESQEQHRCRRVPKGVVTLTSLWCGGLEQIGHKSLHVVVALDILERIVSVRAFHIDKVKHSHVISFGFEQTARISQNLTLRVKNNH